jgi:NAD(P)H-nitrite reductase large subunit
VFVAGDGGGIGGAEMAIAEGRLVGLVVAMRLGRCAPRAVAGSLRRTRARLRRLDRVRGAIAGLWAPPASYTALLTPETIVCRCEEATVDDVTRLIEEGVSSVEPVKAATRVTMGRCQGRNCLPTVAELTARAMGLSRAELELPRARPPARPVVLGDLLHESLPPPRPPELRLP